MFTAKAEINLNALVHNFNMMKACSPRSKIIAVVKGNAYGHDAAIVALFPLRVGEYFNSTR